MINTQATGMSQDRGDHFTKRRVPGCGKPIGAPRRLIPSLALLVERIWRTADRDIFGVAVLQAPGIDAPGTYPNGKIMHHPKRHAGAYGGLLGVSQLLLQKPLQPAVKVDLGGVRSSEGSNRWRLRILQLGWPLFEIGPMLLRQRRPGRVALQCRPCTAPICRERGLPSRRTRHREDDL